jgi:integrating conjugative element protein (TIGR03757 family)
MRAAIVPMLLGVSGLLGPNLAATDEARPHVQVFVAPHQIDRITGTRELEHRWPGVRIAVFDLGAPQRFEAQLSAGLPADPTQAQRMVRERIQAQDLEAQVLAAFGGILQAARLGLDRVPAVVFDDRAIVYGVTDLPAAHAQYERWMDAHP